MMYQTLYRLNVKKAFLCASIVSMTWLSAGVSFAEENEWFPQWNKLEKNNHSVGFHGYVRTGWGSAEGGDTMASFQAPGASAKYRLGNETETYSEIGLDYRYNIDGTGSDDDRFIQLYGMLSGAAPFNDHEDFTFDLNEDSNSQSFIRYGNAFGDGVHAWLGRRFYDRKDIHMNDYFWLNTSGNAEIGGGVEGIPLGMGRLSVAAFDNDAEELSDRLGVATDTKDLHTYALDVRYKEIPTFKNGHINFWGMLAHRPKEAAINYGTENGFGVGLWHEQDSVLNASMTTAALYRQGSAIDGVNKAGGYNLTDAYTVEVNNSLLVESREDYAIQWATVLRHENRGVNGTGGGDTISWASTGVRPVFFLNDYVSLATELGVDYVDNDVLGVNGALGKGTIAVQLQKEKGYYARPSLRLFATGASWSDDFRGLVANGSPASATTYADDTSGYTFGVQLETWW